MNRHEIEVVIPSNVAELNGRELRVVVLDLVESIVNAIVGEGREPDDWEGPDLALALDYLRQDWDTAALTVARRALAEPEDRGRRAEHQGIEPILSAQVLLKGVRLLRD